MRLYKTANGTWAGTQADAKRIAKEEAASFEQVEVPTDKQALIDFLNDYEIDAHDRAAVEVHEIIAASAPEPINMATVAVAEARTQKTSWTANEIEDFLLNHATVAQVENIFSCLGTRFAERRAA